MTIAQFRVTWTGGPSAPGLSVFNTESNGTGNPEAAAAAIADFFADLSYAIPDDYTLEVQNAVPLFFEGTGQLSGEIVVPSSSMPSAVAGTGSSTYMNGVGARVDWATGVIRGGRRVVGRTFLVPVHSGVMDSDGNVNAAFVSAVGVAGDALISALDASGFPLVVWSRPSEDLPVGDLSPVIAPNPSSKPAILRGRRD